MFCLKIHLVPSLGITVGFFFGRCVLRCHHDMYLGLAQKLTVIIDSAIKFGILIVARHKRPKDSIDKIYYGLLAPVVSV